MLFFNVLEESCYKSRFSFTGYTNNTYLVFGVITCNETNAKRVALEFFILFSFIIINKIGIYTMKVMRNLSRTDDNYMNLN